MSVRYWTTLKNMNYTFLIHSHCLKKCLGETAYGQKVMGTWICMTCGETAPDEIQFMADLVDAYVQKECSPTNQLTPKLYNHKEEFLNGGKMMKDLLTYNTPIIATPMEYLYEKIAQEAEEAALRRGG
jgi:hypothetical protein